MSQQAQALEHASVQQYCKAVKVPVIAANFVRLAEQAVKENHSHIGYLEALLAMESEERDRHAIVHRLHDAKLPRMKTLEEFEFAQAPQIPAAKVRELAEGGYIERAEPVVLIGECGTARRNCRRDCAGGVPPKAESALHDGSEPGERAGGGRPASRSAACVGAVDAVRRDRAR